MRENHLIMIKKCANYAIIYVVSAWFLGVSVSTYAQIYKCVGESGATQFSDKPCGKSAEEITVDVPATSGVSLAEPVSEDEKDARQLDREIKQLERKIAKIEKTFDKNMAALSKEFDEAPNTSVGLYRKETILLEMRNLKTQYQMGVMPATRLLSTMKAKKSAIERRDSRVRIDLPKSDQPIENGGQIVVISNQIFADRRTSNHR